MALGSRRPQEQPWKPEKKRLQATQSFADCQSILAVKKGRWK